MLDAYGIREGDELDLEQGRQGILIRPVRDSGAKLPWAAACDEMTQEAAETADWEPWDSATADGVEVSED